MFSSRKSSAPASGGLTKSLRFRGSASAYLNRTPSVASNQTTWTWSGWVKRGNITSGYNTFFSAGDNLFQARFDQTTDDLQIYNYNGSSFQFQFVTTQIFRDPSAWYHIVIAIDTTQATSTNRVKLYVNGSQVTSFSTATYPAQNTNLIVNSVIGHYFGINHGYGSYYDGYLADLYLIDGQQLTPSSFASTNATTGQWSPATYSGSYGTNGFHLTFTNTTSTTTLGYDTSGNSNNWTTNNISLTAGSTYDSMNDVPVAYSATAANYCVLNPLAQASAATLSNGNLNAVASGWNWAMGTIGVTSGKWYWEVTHTNGGVDNLFCGIAKTTFQNFTYNLATAASDNYNVWGYTSYFGNKEGQSVNTSYGATFQTAGDIIGVALDMDAGTLTFYKNGASQGQAFSGITVAVYPVWGGTNSSVSAASLNFGQQPWAYTPPSGYVALNTYNLPTPTIAQGNKYMDATLYTGNGSSQSITNASSFQPDFVWVKSRSNTTNNWLFDSVRGANVGLISNATDAEANYGLLPSFNSNGFGVGAGASYDGTNYSAYTYVGWQWKANGTAVSNTSGSITSSVSANTTAGFSVVTYTGNATNGASYGHGLGVAPSMVITKARSGANDWATYHVSTGSNQYFFLNQTAAVATFTGWLTPSANVNTFTNTSVGVNTSGVTYVAYCFAAVAGFSAFGSYTGNGSTSGPFIYCGFQPRYVMFKRTDTAGYSWFIWDTARFIYNSNGAYLLANSSGSESPYTGINVLSNGFQLVNSVADFNASGGTYIYMAFASNPFAYSNAR